jgi:hypothetical protein
MNGKLIRILRWEKKMTTKQIEFLEATPPVLAQPKKTSRNNASLLS